MPAGHGTPGRRGYAARVTTRVGLTGGVASGKSTVSAILRELGAVVIDADALAREVVAAGTPGLDAVVAEFGNDVLGPDGELDRATMGSLVFSDEDARRRLETIVHPRVYERIVALEAQAPPGAVVVHDIPLLAESGRAGTFDAVVVVDAPRELQVERMVRDRGWTEAEAESRINAQATRADRLALATHVVENSGSLEELRARVEQVYAELVGVRGDRRGA
jgi:dephospho-CoA kinase